MLPTVSRPSAVRTWKVQAPHGRGRRIHPASVGRTGSRSRGRRRRVRGRRSEERCMEHPAGEARRRSSRSLLLGSAREILPSERAGSGPEVVGRGEGCRPGGGAPGRAWVTLIRAACAGHRHVSGGTSSRVCGSGKSLHAGRMGLRGEGTAGEGELETARTGAHGAARFVDQGASRSTGLRQARCRRRAGRRRSRAMDGGQERAAGWSTIQDAEHHSVFVRLRRS